MIMTRFFILLLSFCSAITSFAQWKPVSHQLAKHHHEHSNKNQFYTLDIQQLKSILSHTQEQSRNSAAQVLEIPTLEGKLEKFVIYSFPVMDKNLADRYQLGSYSGVGIDDPHKRIRFSLAPNDFQCMMMGEKGFEFIEPYDKTKNIYVVKPKTKETETSIGFKCSTNEHEASKEQLKKLLETGKNYAQNGIVAGSSSDRRFRTLRLALSVTGEYTQYFGGVAGALAAMNATLTRVNGVMEKDLALHLHMIDSPQIIYTDANTDPYSPASTGANGAWNMELQKTLTAVVGEANYDIGHLFGASGGGGNAGCIGCICVSPTLDASGVATSKAKGSGFTSPSNGRPFGDTFDIDYVAHELGHQLGATHTFSHELENAGTNVEPASGSTIMGYAGITNANVQRHSDPYFHYMSITLIQNNLITKTCDVETAIANNPPVITPMTDITIPKGTAFVLSATATDTEGNPMTYTWEQIDNATSPILTVTGNNTSGALFRSMLPSTTPTRYFPRESDVMNGQLTSSANWETVSKVARETNFVVTVRDNHPITNQQQTSSSGRKIIVGAEGPFQVTSTQVYTNATYPITWNVANTNTAPYYVSDVKIDYTTDNGTSWVTLFASTPNDGTENPTIPTSLLGQTIKIRVSAINHIFYAVSAPVSVKAATNCDGTAPQNIVVSNITLSGARIEWDLLGNATYKIRYRAVGTTVWTEISTDNNYINLIDLEEQTPYEAQVAVVCSGALGSYSSPVNFTTLAISYCAATSSNADEEYISNITVVSTEGTVNSNSGKSTYTNYTADASRLITLKRGTTGNTISLTCTWPDIPYKETGTVWIDYNRNGQFEENEKITITITKPASTTIGQSATGTATFSVPNDAYVGDKTTRMRVVLSNNPAESACNNVEYGEIEDYSVRILDNANVVVAIDEVKIYPNPTSDILNITRTSNNSLFSIYDMSGRLITKGNVNDQKVDVSYLPKGVYIISIVIADNDSKEFKFIKK